MSDSQAGPEGEPRPVNCYRRLGTRFRAGMAWLCFLFTPLVLAADEVDVPGAERSRLPFWILLGVAVVVCGILAARRPVATGRWLRRNAWPFGLAAGFLVLSFTVHFWDEPINSWLRSQPWLANRRVFGEAETLVKPIGKHALFVILALIGIAGYRRLAWRIVLTLIFTGALVWAVKPTVDRARPHSDYSHYSFPSGDTAQAMAFAYPMMTSHPALVAITAPMVGGVAFMRVASNAHWPSDVCAGVAFAIIAGVLADTLLRRWRWRPPRKFFWGMGIFCGATWLILEVSHQLVKYNMSLEDSWFDRAQYALRSTRGGLELVVPYLPALLLFVAWRFWRLRLQRPEARRRFLDWVDQRRGWVLGLVFGGFLLAYLTCVTGSTLWDRDEPRFAKATLEMVASGDYLVPTFNWEPRLHKPILVYWLQSVGARFIDHDTLWEPGWRELGVRFVSPLGLLVAAWFTYLLGRGWFGHRQGVVAAVILLASPLALMEGVICTADAALLACITFSFWALYRGLRPGLDWRGVGLWGGLLGVGLGLAQLAKGPVGLAVILLSGVTFIVLRRKELPVGRGLALLVLGTVVGTAAFLAWALPANAATGGAFLNEGVGKHVVGRSTSAMEGHGGKLLLYLPYYFGVLLIGFFPWCLLLPAALRRLRQPLGPPAEGLRAVFWSWLLPTFLMMTFVATKLPHYILPIFPGLALALAGCLTWPAAREADAAATVDPTAEAAPAVAAPLARDEQVQTWMRRSTWVLYPLGVLIGLGLVVAPWCFPLFGTRVAMAGAGFTVLAGTGLVGHELRRRHFLIAGALMACGMLLFTGYLGLAAMPALETVKLSPPAAQQIRYNVIDERVATLEYKEPSLHFYAWPHDIEELDGVEAAVAFLRETGDGLVVFTDEEYEQAYPQLQELPTRLIQRVEGYHYASEGHAMDLVLIKGTSDTPLEPPATAPEPAP